MELRFIDYSLENYLRVFIELLDAGKENFLARGADDLMAEFMEEAKRRGQNHCFNLYPASDPPFSGKMDSIDAIFIFIKDAELLSDVLMDYAGLKNSVICAPITKNYYKNRYVSVICPLKAGGHMLLKLLHDFGFHGPGDINRVKGDGSFYFLNNIDQHVEITHLSAYHVPPGHIEAFFSQPAILLYRDPRDIAVSLAHFLSSAPPKFLNRPHMQSLYHALHPYFMSLSSQHERLEKVISGAPVMGNIRDFLLPFSGWLDMPNVIPIRFEDLVGPLGGGSLEAQFETILKLQLILHIPGRTLDFAANVFDANSPTFRRGQIGSYVEEMSEEHVKLFKSLPQDFMDVYGYASEFEVLKPFVLWLSGLSDPVKTTLANALRKRFLFDTSAELVVLGAEEDPDFSNEVHLSKKIQEYLRRGVSVCISSNQFHGEIQRVIDDAVDMEICVKCREKNGAKEIQEFSSRATAFGSETSHRFHEGSFNPCMTIEMDKKGINQCLDSIVYKFEELGLIRFIKRRIRRDKPLRYFPSPEDGMERKTVLVEEGYKGFNIIVCNRSYYGIEQGVGPIDIASVDFKTYEDGLQGVSGDSPADVKRLIDKVTPFKKGLSSAYSKVDELSKEVSLRDETIRALNERMEQGERALKDLNEEIRGRQERIEALEAGLNELSGSAEGLKEDIKAKQGAIEALDKDVFSKDERIKALAQEIGESTKTLDEASLEIKDKTKSLYAMQKMLFERDETIRLINTELSARREDIGLLEKALNDLRESFKRLEDESDGKKSAIDALDRTVLERDETIELLHSQIMEKNESARILEQEIGGLKATLDDLAKGLNARMEDLKNEVSLRDETIRDFNEKILEKEDEINGIRERSEGLEKELADKVIDIDALNKDMSIKERSMMGLRRSISRNASKVKRLRRGLNAFRGDFARLNADFREKGRISARLKTDILERDCSINTLNAGITERDRMISALKDEMERDKDSYFQSLGELKEKRKETEELWEEIYVMDHDIKGLKEENARKHREMEMLDSELRGKIKGLLLELTERGCAIESFQKKLEEDRRSIECLTGRLEKKEEEFLSIQKGFEEKEGILSELSSELMRRESSMRSLQDDILKREESIGRFSKENAEINNYAEGLQNELVEIKSMWLFGIINRLRGNGRSIRK